MKATIILNVADDNGIWMQISGEADQMYGRSVTFRNVDKAVHAVGKNLELITAEPEEYE